MTRQLARICLLVTAAAALAGCGTMYTKDGTDGRKYATVCSEEAPTGSHISRLKCYRKQTLVDRQDQDRRNLERQRNDWARNKNPSMDPASGLK
ncbi:MAG TPA: hypothetical protein VK698_08905 [Kofleriaceae bacterium]|nr:hypothetical protein [Kofleriaceae bacterium]